MNDDKLTIERQKMLTNYVAYISTAKGSFEKHGKYIDSVWRFLTDAEEVNRRGWRNYRKNHAEELVYYPWMVEAICDFLTLNGMGMKKTETRRLLRETYGLLVFQRTANKRHELSDTQKETYRQERKMRSGEWALQ